MITESVTIRGAVITLHQEQAPAFDEGEGCWIVDDMSDWSKVKELIEDDVLYTAACEDPYHGQSALYLTGKPRDY